MGIVPGQSKRKKEEEEEGLEREGWGGREEGRATAPRLARCQASTAPSLLVLVATSLLSTATTRTGSSMG